MRTTIRKGNMAELLNQIKERKAVQRDWVVPASCLEMEGGRIVIKSVESEAIAGMLDGLGVTLSGDTAPSQLYLDPVAAFDGQMADILGINRKYYNRMRAEYPELLDVNVNGWLRREPNTSQWLLRAYVSDDDSWNVVRAILSDRYKAIDNFDILLATTAAIQETGKNVVVESCDLTEGRMQVRFYCPSAMADASALLRNYRPPEGTSRHTILAPGADDGIIGGFVISNSETGQGAFSLQPRLLQPRCMNGLIITKDRVRKLHLGGVLQTGEVNWSEATVQKSLELVMSQVKDAVAQFLTTDYVTGVLADLMQYSRIPLSHPVEAVTNTCSHLGMSEEQADAVLAAFIQAGQTSVYGITNAITWYAHEQEDPNLQTQLEQDAVAVLPRISRDFDVARNN